MQFHIQERVEKMLDKNGRESISYAITQPLTVVMHHQTIEEEDEEEMEDQIILPAITINEIGKGKAEDGSDNDGVDQCNNMKDPNSIHPSLQTSL